MSLINMILSQQIVVISLGLALLLMAVAILLTVMGRLRQYNVKRAHRRTQRKANQEAERQALTAFRLSQEQARTQGQDIDEPSELARQGIAQPAAKPAKHSSTTPTTTATPSVIPAAQEGAVVLTTDTTAQPAAHAEPGPSDEMQSILASVFVDDELLARYDVLLRGLNETSISELLALSEKVAGNLKAGRMTAVANKEPR